MIRAVKLRAEGKSLRQIAEEVGCHHDTVWRDLKKWDTENANVIQLSDSTVGKTPPRGENPTTESDSEAPVILAAVAALNGRRK